MNRINALGPGVLVLSASVGGGHLRAAQAVQLAIESLCPAAFVRHIDVLECTNAPFRRFYGKSYFNLIDRAPHLVGYLYDRLDRPVAWSRLDRVRMRLQKLNLLRLVELLVGGGWDLVVNTHFLPAEVLASLRAAGRLDVPQITVTTDFDTHRLWVNEPCDHYFTATEEGRANLSKYVPAERITASGIPIHPDFSRRRGAADCRRRHGLCTDRPVVLQLAGGFGFGPVERIHRGILACESPLHVVAVAGRNAEAKRRLDDIPCPTRHRRTTLGFTDAIADLMAAADVLVSKPGGLTSSEALASGLPMLIVDPIPGQESRNSDYLLENGAAIKVNNLASLTFKLCALLGDEARLDAMRNAALRLARPHAAADVAAHALRMVGWETAPKVTARNGAVEPAMAV